MRYFVKTLSGEKGPYELEQIRDSLRAGRLQKDTLLRPEGSTTTVSAEEVLKLESTSSPAPDDGVRWGKRSAQDVYAPPSDVYAPPGQHGDVTAAPYRPDEGSMLLGFFIGLVGGCIVLAIVLRSAKPRTKTGVFIGLAVQIVLVMLMQASK